MPTVTTTYVIGNGNNGAGANQIASETTSGVTTAYAYDGNGNRTSKSTPVLTTTGNTSNTSTTISSLAGTTGVAVGMAVSGTGIPVGSTVATIVSSTSITISMAATANGTGVSISFTNSVANSYDYENRLVGLTYNVGGTAAGAYSYAYDYRTRRISRTEPSAGTTYIVFDGGVSIIEYGAAGAANPSAEYIRGFNYGGGVGGLEYSVRGGVPSFNFFDSRGDVVTKTNSSGAVTWETAYEAFGNETVSSGTTPADRQRASTKEQDPTGFLNEGFRYRDPDTGTFLTRDPLGFKAGLNNYTYVEQNPWTRFDPEGLVGDSVNESSKNPTTTPTQTKKKQPAQSSQKTPSNKKESSSEAKPAQSDANKSSGASGATKTPPNKRPDSTSTAPASTTPSSGAPTTSARSIATSGVTSGAASPQITPSNGNSKTSSGFVSNAAGTAKDILGAVTLDAVGTCDMIASIAFNIIGDIGSMLPSPMQITTGATSMAQAASGMPPPEGPAAAEAITALGQAASITAAIGPASSSFGSFLHTVGDQNFGGAQWFISDAINRWK
jgi:RHS repeat-associated protein